MSKRILAVLLSLTLMLTAFAGCFTFTAAAATEKTVLIPGPSWTSRTDLESTYDGYTVLAWRGQTGAFSYNNSALANALGVKGEVVDLEITLDYYWNRGEGANNNWLHFETFDKDGNGTPDKGFNQLQNYGFESGGWKLLTVSREEQKLGISGKDDWYFNIGDMNNSELYIKGIEVKVTKEDGDVIRGIWGSFVTYHPIGEQEDDLILDENNHFNYINCMVEDCGDTEDETPGKNYGGVSEATEIQYLVNVVDGGAYKLQARVASEGGGGSFDIKLGSKVIGTFTVPATGAWQTYTTIEQIMNFPAGKYTLVVDTKTPGFNLNWLKVSYEGDYIGTPVGTGTTKIECEDFYSMFGVQVEVNAEFTNIGFIHPGDYLDYKINVQKAGVYQLTLRSTCVGPSAQYHIKLDGAYKAAVNVANTGSWTNYQNFTSGKFWMTAGDHILRLDPKTADNNIDWFELTYIPDSASLDFSTGAIVGDNASITHNHPNEDLGNNGIVEYAEGQYGIKLHKQNRGFGVSVNAGVFPADATVRMVVEYYAPSAVVKDNTRMGFLFEGDKWYRLKSGGGDGFVGGAWTKDQNSVLSFVLDASEVAKLAEGKGFNIYFWNHNDNPDTGGDYIYIRSVKLVIAPDKSELQAAVDEPVDPFFYSRTDVKAYNEAKVAAQEVLDDQLATTTDVYLALDAFNAVRSQMKLVRAKIDFTSGQPVFYGTGLFFNHPDEDDPDGNGIFEYEPGQKGIKLSKQNRGFGLKVNSGIFEGDVVKVVVDYYAPSAVIKDSTRVNFSLGKNYTMRAGGGDSYYGGAWTLDQNSTLSFTLEPTHSALLVPGRDIGVYFWNHNNDAATGGDYVYIRSILLTPVVDKSALQSAVGNAITNLSGYTPESAAVYSAALAEAEDILDDEYAVKEDVEIALQNLMDAAAGLESIGGETADKSELQDAIDAAEAIKAEEGYEDKYTQATRTAFEQALDQAKSVNNDPTATQAVVDVAKTNLINAMNALMLKGEISIDFSVEGYKTSNNFDITEDHSKQNGFNFVDVGDGQGTKAYRLYYHNNGFAMKPKSGVFDDTDFLQIQIEYYWPNDRTQDNSRIHAESGSAYKWFTMRKVELSDMIPPAGLDSWQTYTSDYIVRGSALNQFGIKLMFWENSEAQKDEESVFIKSIKVVKVEPAPDMTALRRLYENRQDHTLFTESSRTAYEAALADAKYLLDHPDEATVALVDQAIADILSSAANLVVRDGIYTTQNTSWDKHEFGQPAMNYSGRLVSYQGNHAWQLPPGGEKYIGISDPNNILDGQRHVVFEYEYFIPSGSSPNSRFFAGHGTVDKYINVSEPENGYSVAGSGHFKQAEVGKWATLKLELTNADTTKRQDDMIMRFGWWGDGEDRAYVRALRAYAVDEQGKMIEGKIVELAFEKTPVDKEDLRKELEKKPENGELKYTESSWNAYMEAWTNAQAVYDDPNADQDSVNNQVAILSAAYQALVKGKWVKIDLTNGELVAINATVSRNEGQFVEPEGIGKAYKMFEHNKGIQIKVDENLFAATDKVQITVEYYYPDSTTLDNTRLGIQVSGINYILRKKTFPDSATDFYTAAEVDKWANYTTKPIDAADVNGKDLLFLFWENTGDNPGYYYIRKITIGLAVEEQVDKGPIEDELDKKPASDDKYTKASWEAYLAKWNAAKAVFDDPNATQAQVNAAKDELAAAFANLKLKALGDIDGDEKYGTSDARLALQAAVGKITLSDDLKAIADVDKDGDVDTTDARLLLQLAVGKIDKLPGAES